MIELLVYLGILVIVAIAAIYVLQQVSLPDPAGRILMVVVIVVIAIVAIILLLQFAHGPGLHLGYTAATGTEAYFPLGPGQRIG